MIYLENREYQCLFSTFRPGGRSLQGHQSCQDVCSGLDFGCPAQTYTLQTVNQPLADPRTAKQEDVPTSITHSSFNWLAGPNVGE